MEKKDVQHQVHLDSAVHLLSGDLAEALTKSGLDNQLQRWIEDLKEQNNPDMHQLIQDLQSLKAHFGGTTTPDGDLVVQLIGRMSTETARLATFAEGNTRPRVEKLSEALAAAAQQLKGGESNFDPSIPQDMSSHKPM